MDVRAGSSDAPGLRTGRRRRWLGGTTRRLSRHPPRLALLTHDTAVVAFVFARGGSKGLPRKNLLPVAGKPLLVHAVELARSLRRVSKVVVSTDDPEIADVARGAGAEVPFLRPADLAGDAAPEWLAWRHAIESVRSAGHAVDVLLSLPPTAPLRRAADVDCCLDTFFERPCDVVVTVREADRNPYFNMVRREPDGSVRLAVDGGGVDRRQDAPVVYDLTTVAYVARADFVCSAPRLFDGRVRAVLIPRERAVDIDNAYDLFIAESVAASYRSTDAARAL